MRPLPSCSYKIYFRLHQRHSSCFHRTSVSIFYFFSINTRHALIAPRAFMPSSSKAKTGAPNEPPTSPSLISSSYRRRKKDGNSESRFLCFQVNIIFNVLRALPLIDDHGHPSIWLLSVNRKSEEVKVVCVCVSEDRTEIVLDVKDRNLMKLYGLRGYL